MMWRACRVKMGAGENGTVPAVPAADGFADGVGDDARDGGGA
jgi:hypothetical protein